MERTLRVEGMHCKSCEMLLADSLSEVEGVSGVKVDRGKGTVTVVCEGQTALDAAKAEIRREGYRVV